MRAGLTVNGIIVAAIAATAIGMFFLWRAERPPVATGPVAPPATLEATGTGSLLALRESPRPVPIVDFVNGDGKPTTNADFGGRVVLLNIWATWCVPCREEMPTLDRLEQKMSGPDFQVVALSLDRQGRDVVAKFYRELGIKALGIYVDQSGKAAGKLEVVGLPTTLLIDRNGYEIGRKVGPAQWDSPEIVRLIQGYTKAAGAGHD